MSKTKTATLEPQAAVPVPVDPGAVLAKRAGGRKIRRVENRSCGRQNPVLSEADVLAAGDALEICGLDSAWFAVFCVAIGEHGNASATANRRDELTRGLAEARQREGAAIVKLQEETRRLQNVLERGAQRRFRVLPGGH